MLDIILLTLAGGIARGINKTVAAQKKLDKELVVCGKCHTESPLGSKFCPKCRNTNLTRRKEFKKSEEQRAAIQAKQDEKRKELEKRIEKAKEYYEYALTMRLCQACNVAFDSEALYCAKCGAETERASSDTVLAWMIAEYPDIVATSKDIELLESFSREGGITIGKIILGTSKAALKGTLWAGTKVGESMLNELSRK